MSFFTKIEKNNPQTCIEPQKTLNSQSQSWDKRTRDSSKRDKSPKYTLAHATQYKKKTQLKQWVEDLNRYFSKKAYRWPKHTWKDVQHG